MAMTLRVIGRRVSFQKTRRISTVVVHLLEDYLPPSPYEIKMAADPITADVAAELLNYDVSDDDPFNDNPQRTSRDDKAMLSPRGTKRKNADEDDNALGINEEVKITKKRKPAVKLDEARYAMLGRTSGRVANQCADCSQLREYPNFARSLALRRALRGSCG